MEGEGESNTLGVLVATDCHLGYMKKDEIRRFDSFQAFEEGFFYQKVTSALFKANIHQDYRRAMKRFMIIDYHTIRLISN
jgi:hypothetical protein